MQLNLLYGFSFFIKSKRNCHVISHMACRQIFYCAPQVMPVFFSVNTISHIQIRLVCVRRDILINVVLRYYFFQHSTDVYVFKRGLASLGPHINTKKSALFFRFVLLSLFANTANVFLCHSWFYNRNMVRTYIILLLESTE